MLKMAYIWLAGLVRRRLPRLAGTILAVAVTVALAAALGGFVSDSTSTMTERAIADVPVDWQIQLASGTSIDDATSVLNANPGYSALAEVDFFHTPAFESVTGATTQTTGAGYVLGLSPEYREVFPETIRDLIGQGQIMLAQQTAANLHAVPGTVVTIARPGLDPVSVTIDSVIELPYADSLFQVVGAPVGATPQAPPDNVLLLPLEQWHSLFDPIAKTAPDSMTRQLHASVVTSSLASSPTDAFNQVLRAANHYESQLAGAAIVGNNLGARLDAARSDALYSQILFLFLGLPGITLSIMLTATIVAIGKSQRYRDLGLLRLRGGDQRQVAFLAAAEALLIGGAGGILGVAAAAGIVRLSFGHWRIGATGIDSFRWSAIAVAIGLITSLATILLPVLRDFRTNPGVRPGASPTRRALVPWERLGLDFIALGIAAISYWQAGRNGYHVVLVPEGIASVSVSYSSFVAPLFLWVGATLLIVRLVKLSLSQRGIHVIPAIRPLGGNLAPLIAASLGQQRTRVATGVVLIAVAVAFACSTSLFNATYQQQALVDAELSNGADITLTANIGFDLASNIADIQSMPGVAAVEPMQHRFAYVGTDLQDIYGVNPDTLQQAATLSDTYFVNGNADDAINGLRNVADGVLISPETALDFQLQTGDLINLRLQNQVDLEYHVIPFHVVGVAREFPTAPSDSFLVANTTYIASVTGSPAVETLLVKTNTSPTGVANAIRQTVGPASGITVRDINEQRSIIDSGLTSISLHGLTRIELVFAVIMSAVGSGLILFVGLEQVQRNVAISSALGAKSRQVGAFIWSEACLMTMVGIILGAGLGWTIAAMLTRLLTGVFDPPPSAMTTPWLYIALVVGLTVTSVAIAGWISITTCQQRVLETIRQL